MTGHPYLRAYMAGVLLPSWVLLIVVAVLLAGHFMGSVPAHVERVIVFPLAVVPNLWGLWNLLYVSQEMHRRVSIGVFGALLPVVLGPVGVALASALDLGLYTVRQAALVLPVAMAVYYLAWKYAVAFFNRVVGLR
jgi:hypothetical protein